VSGVEIRKEYVIVQDGDVSPHVEVTPSLLRNLADMAAKSGGWPVYEAARRGAIEVARYLGSPAEVICCIDSVGMSPDMARTYAVALLRAADEAEVSK
jgi:hypothetical protein